MSASAQYNPALGDRRTLATREYFASFGIPAERLKVISYGKERPARNGRDENCRQ
jgi:peptidoglycan-associated lipoprotein